MLITVDMTLDFLAKKKEISNNLFRFMKIYGVETLGEAISYIDSGLLSKSQRGELEKIQHVIKEKTFLFSWFSIKELYIKGIVSARLYNCLQELGFTSFYQVFQYVESNSYNLFLTKRNLGKKSLLELQTILASLKNTTKEKEEPHNVEIYANNNPANDFLSRYNELIKNDVYKASIEYYYETNKSALSARANHALEQNYTSILEVVNLYFTGLDVENLKSCGKMTYKELNSFIINLYLYISSLFSKNSEETETLLLGKRYPFLSGDEIEFVKEFKKGNSHLPMFYILYHYLTKSTFRVEKLYCRYYGLGMEPENLKEISMSFNLTYERCRQLLKQKRLKNSSLIYDKNWEYYDFLDKILFFNNYDYNCLADDEGLSNLSMSAFIGLCSFVKNIEVYKIGKIKQKEYYVSEKLYDSFDLKGCIKDIDAALCKKCTEDINLPISVFIDSYWQKEPTFNASEVEDIIISILKEDYGINIGEDKVLHISQNAIDRSEEIYKIIEEYGKPMHIKLIKEILISRYPEFYNLSIEQVRGYALRHSRIEALGKSSTYTIDKWKLYTGTIRDLLFYILSEKKEPMNIEKLYDEVSVIYPNTSIKSITSSMVSDELQRFVRFVGSYYGVSDKKYDDEFVVWDAKAYSRKTFNERISELETFLRSHRHIPRYDRDNEGEAALCRWFRRVTANDASISSEQQRRLSELLARNADFLVTATEYSFFRYCEEFKAFIEDNMDFPTLETDSAKYGWFMKNKRIYKDFEDRRKTYFEDLIEFLYTYGFEV